MDEKALGYLVLFILFFWSLWLATCRPDAYNKLSEGMMQRAGMMGRGLFKIIGFGARTYFRNHRRW